MPIEQRVVEEERERDTGPGLASVHGRVECQPLAAANIKFGASAANTRPLDPAIEETVINPVWLRARMM